MKNSQKGFGVIMVIIVILILIGLAVIILGMMTAGGELARIESREKRAQKNPVPVTTLTKNWKEYKNEKFNIAFKHPSDLTPDIRDKEGWYPSQIYFKSSKGNPVFYVNIYNTVEVYSRSGPQYLTKRASTLKNDYPDATISTTTVNFEKAFLLKSCLQNGNCTNQIYTARGNYYYEIGEAIRLDSTIEPQTFEGVMATFAFIK